MAFSRFGNLISHRRYVSTLSLFSSLMSSIPPIQTFTVRMWHVTSTESNHPHFPRVSNVMWKVPISFSQKLLLCRITSRVDTTILSSSSLESVVISLSHPHNLHFFLFYSHHIHHNLFSSYSLHCVALKWNVAINTIILVRM